MKNKVASFSVAFIVLSLVSINISAFISQPYGQQQTPTNIRAAQINTELQVFLDGNLQTDDPVIYELTIKEFLNITVKYLDNESQYIDNATIQMIGEGLILNFSEQSGLEQYYLPGGLNTTDLGVGIKLFTIIAQAPNYSIKTVDLRITIHRIIGTISRADGDDQIEVYSGDDVVLNIILKDPYNNTIKGAIATYIWAYGQGELYDSDNDGIYNITLFNVPEGIYVIKINAILGDDYTFKEYEITLIVSTPPSYFTLFLSLLILLLLYIIALFS